MLRDPRATPDSVDPSMLTIKDLVVAVYDGYAIKDSILKPFGGRWEPGLYRWEVPLSEELLDALIDASKNPANEFDEFEVFLLQELKKQLSKNKENNFNELVRKYRAKIVEPGKIKLLPHQVEAVVLLMDRKDALLLNWDMGTGKSYAPLALAASLKTRAFVILPATTAVTFFDKVLEYGLTAALFPNNKKIKAYLRHVYKDNWDEADVVICSYATWRNYYKKPVDSSGKTYAEWVAENFGILVFDEAHYIKTNRRGGKIVQRTKASFDTARLFVKKRTEGKTRIVVFMTGTALENKPVDLYNVLKFILKDEVPGFRKFAELFNGATFEPYYRLGSPMNLDILRGLVKKAVHRVKKDEIDLPPKLREVITLPVPSGVRLRPVEEHVLSFVNKYRKNVAEAKVKGTVEFAENAIEQGEAVLIFTDFIDVNNAIAEELRKKGYKVGQIHSGLGHSMDERQEEVNKFQRGEYHAMVANIRAGGVGLTMTKARVAIFNDLPWVPGQLLQAEDRIHRVGQDRKVTIYIMRLQDEFDYMLWDLINEKTMMINTVMDGIEQGLEVNYAPSLNETVTKELIARLKEKNIL